MVASSRKAGSIRKSFLGLTQISLGLGISTVPGPACGAVPLPHVVVALIPGEPNVSE